MHDDGAALKDGAALRDAPRQRRLVGLLLASVFAVATCGLIYELLAGTIASYLLGDSVTQFSTIIGTYLFAMGVGSWSSRYVRGGEMALFIRIELLIALLGGFSAAGLFALFRGINSFFVAFALRSARKELSH